MYDVTNYNSSEGKRMTNFNFVVYFKIIKFIFYFLIYKKMMKNVIIQIIFSL